jgi:phosphate uptake regulator
VRKDGNALVPVVTGGSSFVITLPKDRVQEMQIKKNDLIRLTRFLND